jgi:hypothetical protein
MSEALVVPTVDVHGRGLIADDNMSCVTAGFAGFDDTASSGVFVSFMSVDPNNSVLTASLLVLSIGCCVSATFGLSPTLPASLCV